MAQINELDRCWVWREYMAAVAYSIGKITAGLSGNEYPMPTYHDLTSEKPVEDDESGQDIVSGLIARLGKG